MDLKLEIYDYLTFIGPSPGINRAPIARMKMILRPVESPYHFLSSDSVKPSK